MTIVEEKLCVPRQPVASASASAASATSVRRPRKKGRAARRRGRKKVPGGASDDSNSSGSSSAATSSLQNLPLNVVIGITPSSDTLSPPLCSSLTLEDERAVSSRLGYLPSNAYSVSCRWASTDVADEGVTGTPVALCLYPLVRRRTVADNTSRARGGGKIRRRGQRSSRSDSDAGSTGGGGNGEGEGDTLRRKANRDWHVVVDGETLAVEPFPTLYWLVDRELSARISRMELASSLDGENFGIASIERRLREDNARIQMMDAAHRAYGMERWNYLTPADRAEVLRRRWGGALGSERGVGGSVRGRKEGHVKCLHQHAAHYLSGGMNNLVGQWVCEKLGLVVKKKDNADGSREWVVQRVEQTDDRNSRKDEISKEN
mmetsp:Transcript_23174/g.52940  ORF Transcript_23174/g.52940 Transcript_23174/m.52940 type:complete len:376 (-) Transcript_23174:179-1306(-)|eukprot:CAMPEP_0113302948 /NCGR_PEP_ID=MMETSP0010_2-20120614/3567_1 /TAXON_ID=216773 ORGANISM="Corethron hystrix, Strain 308" /NCGR_SAMPLE_ID=MMETSP0010_2 /ASSEMBLY_ACC=CAM_ASM_000155 /LENGTH=375 /DNA_ID=CAMNT_0000156861 /DNA_START=34 /DNA_END=1161 /DNA_ORIENTATION=- /assembly_acc=CAM_ASM_000155